MSDITQNATGALVGVSMTSSATVATGLLSTINMYAPLIGLCLSFISILLAVFFFAVNHRRESIKNDKFICELRNSIMNEILSEQENDKP